MYSSSTTYALNLLISPNSIYCCCLSHLHGHQFQLVHKSSDVTSDDPSVNPPVGVEGMANPMRRDTVEVPATGNAFLRFRADNPGTWFFHCECLGGFDRTNKCVC